MARSLERAFEGLAVDGIAFEHETQPASHSVKEENREYYFRALARYTATAVSELFYMEGGEAFRQEMLNVLTGKSKGLLLQGLPKSPAQKGLFIHGLKALLGGEEGFGNRYAPEIPQIVERGPLPDIPAFHSDGNPKDLSFMMLASAQTRRFNVPTLFKLTEAKNEDQAEHYFEADELVLVNNNEVQHSTGVSKDPNDFSSRRLIRSHIDNSSRSHTMGHVRHVTALAQQRKIPAAQSELKEWLIKERGGMRSISII